MMQNSINSTLSQPENLTLHPNEKVFQFQEIMKRINDSIGLLFIPDIQKRKFEQNLLIIHDNGMKIAQSYNLASGTIPASSFITVFDDFYRSLITFSKTSAIDRIQNFFKAKISHLKTYIRVFDSPIKRINLTKFISSLEEELLVYKSVSCKTNNIQKSIQQISE